VELAPGRWPRRPRRSASSCFNPCFCGTRARTRSWGLRFIVPPEFQSLFLWNSRPDVGGRLGRRDRDPVSILVFVELAPGQKEARTSRSTPDVSILVFVELAPGRWRLRLDSRATHLCFNPCFCGTRARTEAGAGGHILRKPVSILVFVELAPGPRPR